MKKIAITLALAVATISSFGQGHVNFVNGTSTRSSTNSIVNYLGQATGIAGASTGSAPTSTQAPQGYIYALLAQSWDGSSATVSSTLANVLTSGWTFTGLTATNALAGGSFTGGADATTAAGMPLGAQNQFIIVGWSSTLLGLFNWNTFSAALGSSSFAQGGYVGISTTGTGTASVSPVEGLFGGTGIGTGITLFSTTTAVPEPATIALAGLGGLALLALRRKK